VASGVVELYNGVLIEDRALFTLKLIYKLHIREMEKRQNRLTFAQDLFSKGDKIILYAAAILDKNKFWARRSYVALAVVELYLVTAYVTQQAYKEWLAESHVVNCKL
jgi:hypothetical protein